jgi:hypothetical protein
VQRSNSSVSLLDSSFLSLDTITAVGTEVEVLISTSEKTVITTTELQLDIPKNHFTISANKGVFSTAKRYD